MTQGSEPDWGPLLEAVGEEVMGDFMWMFEVVLTGGKRLQAYKHIDTRGYLHLDDDGGAFFYVPPNGYQSIAVADLLTAVLTRLEGLAGVTEEQVSASWAAVERLRRS